MPVATLALLSGFQRKQPRVYLTPVVQFGVLLVTVRGFGLEWVWGLLDHLRLKFDLQTRPPPSLAMVGRL